MLQLSQIELRADDFVLKADFTVAPAAKVAIIGPSGAGKSTLLDTIAGFKTPASGRIFWENQDITDAAPGDRPLSIVFQDSNLFPHLSVFANVALGVRPDQRLSDAEKNSVVQALRRVGLEKYQSQLPGQLSGGQISRVALARVLVRRMPLILLDEPFAALGPALRAEMLDLVSELATDSDAMLLMVTHDPRDAERIADQTILVTDGRAHPPQDTKALLANPPQTLRDYLG